MFKTRINLTKLVFAVLLALCFMTGGIAFLCSEVATPPSQMEQDVDQVTAAYSTNAIHYNGGQSYVNLINYAGIAADWKQTGNCALLEYFASTGLYAITNTSASDDPHAVSPVTAYLSAGKTYRMHVIFWDILGSTKDTNALTVYYGINNNYSEAKTLKFGLTKTDNIFTVDTSGTYNFRFDNDNDYDKDGMVAWQDFCISYDQLNYVGTSYESDGYYALPKPMRTGYEFKGWEESINTTHDFSLTANTSNYNYVEVATLTETGTYDIIMSQASVSGQYSTVIYDFTDNKSLARFDRYGGQGDVKYSITMPASANTSHNIKLLFYAGLAGETANKSANFTAVGVIKAGSSTGSKYAINNSSGSKKIFVASWDQIQYTVTFDPMGGTLATGEGKTSCYYGVDYQFPQTPSRAGYSFDGWYTSTYGGTKVTTCNTASDHTLYAHWTLIRSNLTINANGGTVKENLLHSDYLYNNASGRCPAFNLNYESGNFEFTSTGITSVRVDELDTIHDMEGPIQPIELSGVSKSDTYVFEFDCYVKDTGNVYQEYFVEAYGYNSGDEMATCIHGDYGDLGHEKFIVTGYENYYLVGYGEFWSQGEEAGTVVISSPVIYKESSDVSTYSVTLAYERAYALPVPTRKGYTFTGWTFSSEPKQVFVSEKNDKYSTIIIDEEDITATANWTRSKYQLTVDGNGGMVYPNYFSPSNYYYKYGYNSASCFFYVNDSGWIDFEWNGSMQPGDIQEGNSIFRWGNKEPQDEWSIEFDFDGQINDPQTKAHISVYGYDVGDSEATEVSDSYFYDGERRRWIYEDITGYEYYYIIAWCENADNIQGIVSINHIEVCNYRDQSANTLSESLYCDQCYMLPVPYRAGYNFTGWTFSSQPQRVTQSEHYSSIYTICMSDSDITATANWEEIVYTATLDNQSATTTGSTAVYYKYGANTYYSNSTCITAITSITVPTRTGYTFGGYYTSKNGVGTQYITANGTFTNNLNNRMWNSTLYAKWTINSHTLTMKGVSGTVRVNEFISPNFSKNFSKYTQSYYFVTDKFVDGVIYFYGAKEGKALEPGNVKDGNNVFFWGREEREEWTVKFDYECQFSSINGYLGVYGYNDGDTEGELLNYINVEGQGDNSRGTATFENLTGYDHYYIIGWWDGEVTNLGDGIAIDNIFVYDSGVTWVQGDPMTHICYNQYYTLPVLDSRVGYKFTGWTFSSEPQKVIQSYSDSNIYTILMGDENIVATAQWEPIKYVLIARYNGGSAPETLPSGWTSASTTYATRSVAYGSAYGELPVPTRAGYSLKGWFTSTYGGTQVTASTTMGAADRNIYAQWTANQYQLTADCNGGSAPETLPSGWTANGTKPYKSVAYNSSYGQLVEPTRLGYIFAGWFTAASGGTEVSSGTQMTSTAGATIYAHWVESWVNYKSDALVQDQLDGYYKIGSAADLACLSYLVNYNIDDGKWATAKYKQTADIDLSGHYWQPIGTVTYPFKGIFDGKTYDINNMQTYRSEGGYWYSAHSYQGILGVILNATIENVNSYNVNVHNAGFEFGCVVGYANESTISNCRASGTIETNYAEVGGIVGGVGSAIVKNCENYAEICAMDDGGAGSGIGGIVGYNYGNSTIENCVNYAGLYGSDEVGGILGHSEGNATIKNCVNYGFILSEYDAGGIIGYTELATVLNCVNAGEIEAYGRIGGVTSCADEIIVENFINTGRLDGSSGDEGCGIGGILGDAYSTQITITSCYVECEISALSESTVGAFIGNCREDANVTIVYCGANITLTNEVENLGAFYNAEEGATVICNDSYALIDNGGSQINRISTEHSSMDGHFGMIDQIHNGLPIPLGIYHVSQYGTTEGIANYLTTTKGCTEA